MSALASDKADKYEYITGEEMPPQDRGRVIEHAKCSNQGERQIKEKVK